jgi:rhodanese-related sulfurtransferase
MLDAALLASSSQAGQSSPSTAAAQRAVLMDETEDDAAEHCATVAAAAASSVSASLFQNASLQSTNCSSGGVLPSLSSAHSDVKRISCATMARLLRGDFRSLRAGGSLPDGEGLDNFIIIDCRYAYEYSGGHIDGAINLNDRALLSKFFRVNSTVGAKLAVVFHCEFSQNRAPKSYRFFRSLDRLRNSASYPLLSFPEIAVLDGGYKNFFAHYPDHCEPRAYVSMWDEQFQHECRTETSKHRKSWGTGKCAGQERGGAAGGFGAGGGGSRSRSSRRRSTTTGGLEFEMPLSYPTAAASSAAASSIGLGLGAALAPSPNTGSFPFVRSLSAVNLSNAGLEAISASPAAAATVVGVASPSTSSSSAASGAGADSPGSAPPSAPRRLHGASMFSPMESDSNPASATAASCHLGAGMGADRSPLPSFSLGSAAHSPADAGAPATAAATSAAAPLSFASGSNSAAATPPHSHGLSHALAGVSPLQPLAFRLSLSSPSPKR